MEEELARRIRARRLEIEALRGTPDTGAQIAELIGLTEVELLHLGAAKTDAHVELTRELAMFLDTLAWPGLRGRLLAIVDTLISAGFRDPIYEASRAAALVDLTDADPEHGGAETAAILVRHRLKAGTKPSSHTATLIGMLGRAEKDQMTRALRHGDRNAAACHGAASLAAYAEAAGMVDDFPEDPERSWLHRWPHNNLVAVDAFLARHELAGKVTDATRETVDEIADALHDRLTRIVDAPDGPGRTERPAVAWDYATLFEIELARLGDHAAADRRLHKFAERARDDLSKLHGMLRQIRRIHAPEGFYAERWLRLLSAGLVAKGEKVIVDPATLASARGADQESAAGYEAVFGGGPHDYHELMAVIACSDRVAEICHRATGARVGTGFLARLEGVPEVPDGTYLLTNAHVCEWETDLQPAPPTTPPHAGRPDAMVARFPLLDPDGTWDLAPVRTSPRTRLDITILALQEPQEVPSLALEPLPARLVEAPHGTQVFIIGFPERGGLSVSLQNNRVLTPAEAGRSPGGPALYHRLPTRPGSSGSPVLLIHREDGVPRPVVVAVHCGVVNDGIGPTPKAIANRAIHLSALGLPGQSAPAPD